MLSLLVTLLIGLIIVGLCYWVITQLPLPPVVRQIAVVVVVVCAALWLISVLAGVGGVSVPDFR